MSAHASSTDSQAQIEAAQIYKELCEPYRSTNATLNAQIMLQYENIKRRQEQEKLRQEQESKKKSNIPWFTVGAMMSKLSESSNENKKLKKELTKALNEINKKK